VHAECGDGRDLGPFKPTAAALRVLPMRLPTDGPRGSSITKPRAHPLPSEHEQDCVWVGDVTWRQTGDLREALFDHFEVPDSTGVRLDVRAVTALDRTTIALLIAANHRAAARGRRLLLIDNGGLVSAALSALHLHEDFLVVQTRQPGDRVPSTLPSYRPSVLASVPWRNKAACARRTDAFRMADLVTLDPVARQESCQLAEIVCATCAAYSSCQRHTAEHRLWGVWAGQLYEDGHVVA